MASEGDRITLTGVPFLWERIHNLRIDLFSIYIEYDIQFYFRSHTLLLIFFGNDMKTRFSLTCAGNSLERVTIFFAFKIFLLFSRLNKRFLWKTLVVEEDHLRQVSFINNICAHTFFQISRWWCGWHIIMITGFLTFWESRSFIFCLSSRSQKISDSCWQRFAHYLFIF